MTKKVLSVVAFVMACALVVGGGLWYALRPASDEEATGRTQAPRQPSAPSAMDAAQAKYVESLPFELVESLSDVAPDREFTFALGYDPATFGGSEYEGYGSSITVYSDVALTRPAAHSAVFEDGVLTVAPGYVHPAFARNIDLPDLEYGSPQGWGQHQDYYIVDKRDPSTGDELTKPRVTHFTAKAPMAAPEVSVEVDGEGVAHLSWEPVDGASTYFVVKYVRTVWEDGRADYSAPSATVIGVTSGSEWTSIQDDTWLADQQDEGLVFAQNDAMASQANIEDDLHGEGVGSFVGARDRESVEYGVVAQGDAGTSPYRPIDGDVLNASLPASIAFYAMREMGISVSSLGAPSFDEIPMAIPISMADGRTVLLPVVIDPANTVPDTVEKGHFDEDDTFVPNGTAVPVLSVPFAVEGTLISGKYLVSEFDEATASSELDRIVQRNLLARAKTGSLAAYSYATEPKDISNVTPVLGMPDIPFEMNGSSPAVVYIAAHLAAGSQFIDLSEYDQSGEDLLPLDLNAAITEAKLQNPYVFYGDGYHYYSSEKILEVEYSEPLEVLKADQQEIADEVSRVADLLLTDGMSDRDKALAINDYLVGSAEYDYYAVETKGGFNGPLVPRAWTPAGVLVDKKGVCASYSYAFQALADEVGLESVVVTGMVGDTRHAWNKAKIDGAWTNIDVTWNDATPPDYDYFDLSDMEMSETRVEDSSWMDPALIPTYATS